MLKIPLRTQMAFACENVTSEPGGPVTFQNVMDGVAAEDFPAPTGRWFAIFCFFSEGPQSITNCRVVIESAKGELLAQQALKDVTFSPENPISRNVVSFQGLSWPYPGGYLIKFMGNRDDVIAYIPMWVQHVPASAKAPEAPETPPNA
jgi:hypothetical protein